MCDYNGTDADRDDDREAMADDHAEALEYCAVCGELACLYSDCPIGCRHKRGAKVEHEPEECGACGGYGVDMPAGSCGGGCEFCPVPPLCHQCRGTGRQDTRPSDVVHAGGCLELYRKDETKMTALAMTIKR